MTRLTERLHEGCYGVAYCVRECDGSHRICEHDPETCPAVNDCFDKLGRLEDLQEAGRLVELPCALGTTVWTTKWWDNVTETVEVGGKKFHRQVMEHKVTKTKFSLYDLDDFGKTVFLTRKEAEAALKGGVVDVR